MNNKKDHNLVSELKFFFWIMVVISVLYVQGLGIQMVLNQLGVKS